MKGPESKTDDVDKGEVGDDTRLFTRSFTCWWPIKVGDKDLGFAHLSTSSSLGNPQDEETQHGVIENQRD